jgi:hypothetical protein
VSLAVSRPEPDRQLFHFIKRLFFRIKFMQRHFWGCLLFICFIGGLIACLPVPKKYIWCAVLSSFGTGISALILFRHPIAPKPFEKIYHHEDWIFDPKMAKFPILTIRAAEHGMGKKPRLEFRQGDFVFPWSVDADGNITITRDNDSIGRLKDLGVIIRHDY